MTDTEAATKAAMKKKLVAVRGGHKAYATKLMKDVSDENVIKTISRSKLHAILKALSDRKEMIIKIDGDILEFLGDDEYEEEIIASGDYVMKLEEAIFTVTEAIECLSMKDMSGDEKITEKASKSQKSPTDYEDSSDDDDDKDSSKKSSKRVQLPKIPLKTFSGDVLKFQEWWESFEVAVHEEEAIKNVMKFNYLRQLLEGNAASVIAGIPLTAKNYAEAVSLLHERYGNKQVLISGHIDKLLNLSPVTSNTDTKKLRELHDEIEVNVRCLKNLDIASSTYGPVLVNIIMSKLPEDIKLIVSRAMASVNSLGMGCSDEWKIDELLKSLKQEIESREMCYFVSHSRNSELGTGKKYQEKFSAASLVTSTDTYSSHPGTKCVFCDQSHASWKCSVVTEISSRKNILRKRGRCYICLERNHISPRCPSNYKCVKCKGRHNVSLCEPNREKTGEKKDEKSAEKVASHVTVEEEVEKPKDEVKNEEMTKIATNIVEGRKNTTFLQSAKTMIGDEKMSGRAEVRILFDNCSQKSFLTEEVAKKLKLSVVKKEPVIVNGFGGKTEKVQTLDVVRAAVFNDNNEKCGVVDFYVVPFICRPIEGQHIELAKATYEHLINLKLADSTDGETKLKVDALVGADFYWSLVTTNVISGPDGPKAIRTTFGKWVLSGRMMNHVSSTNLISTHVMQTEVEDENLEELVKKFWNSDTIDDGQPEESDVWKKFRETTKFENGHYVVELPKKEADILPDNYQLARARLLADFRRMKADPKKLKDYDDIIKSQEEAGIIEDVDDDVTCNVGEIHYLPHRPVIREDRETTKMRIVYDASAKLRNNICLNDMLEKGPCMLPKIFDIHVRFRCYKYAVISDIKQAFLKIFLNEADRDLVRFLWVSDINSDDPEIVRKRFVRVMFGLTPSPFLLSATVTVHMEKFIEECRKIIEKFLRDIYMDDSMSGAQIREEAFEFYQSCKKLMLKGGFELRKWVTNDPELQEMILKSEREVYGDVEAAVKEEVKVLGIRWKPREDCYIAGIDDVMKWAVGYKGPVTKRHMLKVTASHYDPMGYLTPITVRFKLLLQETFKLKLSWDETINDELAARWQKLLRDCVKFDSLVINRHYLHGRELSDVARLELHGFSDASGKAYACVIYLRAVFHNGDVLMTFVASKSKVAPIREDSETVNTPRLELMACVLLSSLMKAVMESFTDYEFNDTYCWTDSKDCIHWITSRGKVWSRFVQNRVKKIHESSPNSSWRHCPGLENPADIPSRGLDLTNPERRQKWLRGASFLQLTSDQWPRIPDIPVDVNECISTEISVHVATVIKDTSIDDLINKRTFYSFKKLVMVTYYVRRFVNNCIRAIKKQDLVLGEISLHERNEAKRLWLRNEQAEISDKQFKQLTYTLGAYKDDDGIIKLKGRLENADLKISTKFPILIPKTSFIGDLIIRDAHADVLHYGMKDTLTQVRDEYWLVQGRARVRKVLNKCFLCRKYGGRLLKKLPAAPLPDYRTMCCDPFTYVGVDYLGPLHVYPTPSSKKGVGTLEKVHVVLFTCANTRAVHLDVVPDTTSAAFINCLKRFFGRRGYPMLFIGDNAKCFIAGETKRFLQVYEIEWKFILEVSPWWGGFYERLVQTVKRALRKILRRSSATYDELLTVITEIESVVNCRPLCYLYSDEVDAVLTPSHLINGRRLISRNVVRTDVPDESSQSLNNRVKYLKMLMSHYENRWKKEYLSGLREFQKNENRIPAQQIKIGDVVLIEDEDLPRQRWRLGKVEELITSTDGFVRGAKLRVHNEKRKISYINRPVNKLCFFEVSSNESDLST